MADPLYAYHKAIFVALDGVISVPVYDYIPQNAGYPYVEIERHLAAQNDHLVAEKDRVFTYITVWSEYKGQKEVLQVMEEINTILHRAKLTLDSGTMVRCLVESRDTARDMDEVTFTGRMKLDTLVEH